MFELACWGEGCLAEATAVVTESNDELMRRRAIYFGAWITSLKTSANVFEPSISYFSSFAKRFSFIAMIESSIFDLLRDRFDASFVVADVPLFKEEEAEARALIEEDIDARTLESPSLDESSWFRRINRKDIFISLNTYKPMKVNSKTIRTHKSLIQGVSNY